MWQTSVRAHNSRDICACPNANNVDDVLHVRIWHDAVLFQSQQVSLPGEKPHQQKKIGTDFDLNRIYPIPENSAQIHIY